MNKQLTSISTQKNCVITDHIKKQGIRKITWIIPFTLQTPCLRITIWGSSGCKSLSSCRISSILALCSLDNCMAAVTPVLPTFFPNTTRESPRFATYRVCWFITPTRQHDPAVAISGLALHKSDTWEVNPSSVRRNALSMVSAVTTPWVSAHVAA